MRVFTQQKQLECSFTSYCLKKCIFTFLCDWFPNKFFFPQTRTFFSLTKQILIILHMHEYTFVKKITKIVTRVKRNKTKKKLMDLKSYFGKYWLDSWDQKHTHNQRTQTVDVYYFSQIHNNRRLKGRKYIVKLEERNQGKRAHW